MSKIQIPSLLEMLKSGVHFGHQTAKWHPKMKEFIYGSRAGVHIIDLEKTRASLEKALGFIKEIAAAGGTVLFVSLKEQSHSIVREAAISCSMPYITERWLGGVFTNFSVIVKLLRRLDQLEGEKTRGEWEKYSKKEQLDKQKDFDKLNDSVGGIRTLTKLPQVVFLIGTREGKHAIRESVKAKVPVVAVVDSNTNPKMVDYIIPANDDALHSIQMIVGLVAEAVKEGKDVASAPVVKV
ncbi:MAG: 30S ribosomal protein S2 [Patescibacteria group bacterium]